MNESRSRIAAAIATSFPKTVISSWSLSDTGKLRVFLPRHVSIEGILSLRVWLVQNGYMYVDGGFTIKPDEECAYISAYLRKDNLL